MSQVAVLERMRTLIASVDGIRAAYSAGSAAEKRMPPALKMLPCAIVYPGATREYILSDGQKRHTYEAVVQVFAQGGDPGAAAFDATPMPDAIIEVFEGNVALGGLCNSCLFLRTEGLQVLQYGGTDYVGYQLYFEVSEQAAASPAIGDPPP